MMTRLPRWIAIALIATCAAFQPRAGAADAIRVLVIDGRNNHDWRRTTEALAATLKSTGRFTVDVSTAPTGFPKPMPVKPKAGDAAAQPAYDAAMVAWKAEERAYAKEHDVDWDAWRPRFSEYAAVVNDYNGAEWPAPVKEAFVDFVRSGGGVVNVHAANNAFPNWAEFNAMIGIGWRGATFGQRVAVDGASGKPVVVLPEQEKVQAGGFGSSHGSKHAFVVKVRDASSPIVAGLPPQWMHGKDELYHRMRGSLENLHVVASAFSTQDERGTGLDEPVLWWVPFGNGRVVTTSLGHVWPNDPSDDGVRSVDFQTIFARSVEWAATGKVTLPVPRTFPSPDKASLAEPGHVEWGK